MLKPFRSAIACELCRKSKIRCKNAGDHSACDRCVKLGRDACVYKPKGPQQVRRSIERGKSTIHQTKKKEPIKQYHYSNSHLERIVFPPQFLLLKVINIFFSNQYNGIFQFLYKDHFIEYYKNVNHVDKDYLLHLNSQKSIEWDPLLILAILSICARFEPSMIQIYGSFNEDGAESFEPCFDLLSSDPTTDKIAYNTSNYFGYHARQLISDIFDKPSVQRIQALAILSSHEWGNTNASRSYLYNGVAARMSLILGLNNPSSLTYRNVMEDKTLNHMNKTIKLEVYRRTMWSVYMMDRANASGRGRSFAVKIEDVRIPLPCFDYEFQNGMESKVVDYDMSLGLLTSVSYQKDSGLISILGFQIFFFELWSKISKWCGEVGSVKEGISPLNKSSNFNKLINDLELLESKMPSTLTFSIENLTAHIDTNNVEQYGYLHCLIFLSKTFLYREVFYLQRYIGRDGGLISSHDWWQYTKQLLAIVKDSSNLIKTLRSTNLIVDAPFLAFQIFTNSIICLYFVAFANEFTNSTIDAGMLQQLGTEFQKLGELNIDLLGRNIWTLGEKYHSIIKELDKNNLRNYLVVDTLKNKIHDYGQSEITENGVDSPADLTQTPGTSPGTLIVINGEDSRKDSVKHGQEGKVDMNMSELIQGFGLENWENFDMGNVLPGWDSVELSTNAPISL